MGRRFDAPLAAERAPAFGRRPPSCGYVSRFRRPQPQSVGPAYPACDVVPPDVAADQIFWLPMLKAKSRSSWRVA